VSWLGIWRNIEIDQMKTSPTYGDSMGIHIEGNIDGIGETKAWTGLEPCRVRYDQSAEVIPSYNARMASN
jgi:hypothetical protein